MNPLCIFFPQKQIRLPTNSINPNVYNSFQSADLFPNNYNDFVDDDESLPNLSDVDDDDSVPDLNDPFNQVD